MEIFQSNELKNNAKGRRKYKVLVFSNINGLKLFTKVQLDHSITLKLLLFLKFCLFLHTLTSYIAQLTSDLRFEVSLYLSSLMVLATLYV
jgi:hypothetical protein